jgi:hypothetical protein
VNQAHVSRLTLVAADEALVRRGAVLVEDAMNIATLSAAHDHRVIIVRHFDIGVIAEDAAPQTVALQIERRLAHVQGSAVPAVSAAARAAPAVWFADEVIAIAQLARRIVEGPPPREWFWPHVAAGAVKHAAPHALHACLIAAARTPAGPLALSIVIAAIEDAQEGALLDTLAPDDAAPLLQLAFGVTEPAAVPPTHARGVLGDLTSRWRARLARWVPRWRGDGRAHWLAALAAIHSRGAVASPAVELARAATLVAAAMPIAARANTGAAPRRRIIVKDIVEDIAADPERAHAQASERTSQLPEPTEPRALHPRARDLHREAPARDTRHGTTEDADGPAAGVAAPITGTVAPAIAPAHAPTTTVGGALFLVRPLAALGIAEWLDAHPWADRTAFAARLLSAIAADHLANPDADDPLVAALAGVLADGPFVAPAGWRALCGVRPRVLRPIASGGRVLSSGSLPLAAWHGRRPSGLPTARGVRRGALVPARPWARLAWERALARWLRTFAALRLPDVVRRIGTLAASATHLELTLPLRSVDIRIRAAGLDVDPGWVPWLGRIVRFHYAGEAAP